MEEPQLATDTTPLITTTSGDKKIMSCCGPKARKWTVFGFAVFFIVVGIVLAVFTDMIVDKIKDNELNVGSKDTIEYGLWEETPIPMFIEFYLFNWTNPQEVVDSKWAIKPHFNQMGPYTYQEKHYRKNVVFNDNHTLTYQTQRIWHWDPDKTVGSLDDQITMANPILLTLVNMVKYKHAIVKMGVNFFIEEKRINLTVTKSAREIIFDGYEDPLLDLVKKLHLRHIDIPFTRFAWFAERNGSITYDGTYNMYDGTDDIRKLGKFYQWNYETRSGIYPGNCGLIGGTSGELLYPVEDDPSMLVFTPDACSTIKLSWVGEEELYGVTGHRFKATDEAFDNGTKYPAMACFSASEKLPAGVRNISACKFGAPAIVSFPHFYLADPSYREAIDGMKPDPAEHEVVVAVEPATGLPLRAKVAAQISFKIDAIDRIKLLENVKPTYMPGMWFKQYATLTKGLASQGKLIIQMPTIGKGTGYGLIVLGCLLLIIFGYLTWRNLWGGRSNDGLINQEHF